MTPRLDGIRDILWPSVAVGATQTQPREAVLDFYAVSSADRSPTIYGRVQGVIELYCPACGTFRRHRCGPRGPWVVRCSNDMCLRHWAIGLAVHAVSSGSHGVPPDTIFPPPRWLRERWRAHTNINILECDSKDDLPVLLQSRRSRRFDESEDDNIEKEKSL